MIFLRNRDRPGRGGKRIWGIPTTGFAALHPWLHSSALLGPAARVTQQSPRPQEKESLQRQTDATDQQIDHLVYDLYGLTADEIKIVEESTS